MNDIELSTKEQIIMAALDIINRKGFQNTTIREIAGTAKVNVAAVNYYFGSKENLFNDVSQYLLEKIKRIIEKQDEGVADQNELLVDFLKKFTAFFSEYPGFIKGIISKLMQEEELYPGIEGAVMDAAASLKDIIGKLLGTGDERLLNFKTAHIVSSVLFPLLLSHYGKKLFGMDFTDAKTREQYIDILFSGMKEEPAK